MKTLRALAALTLLAAAPASFAALSTSYEFNGNGNWSIDGAGDIGGFSSLRATVPAGSTVEKAFLYTSTYFNAPRPLLFFGGQALGPGRWDALGVTAGQVNGLQAFRSDVTGQVARAVAAGGEFVFSVVEQSLGIDGQVLAVVYSNAAESVRNIAFLDGFSTPFGDQSEMTLANPLTAEQLADPGFEASMSLGIGFSDQSRFIPQESQVDVNGRRLTSAAGGFDDGQFDNGGLITVGDTYDDDFSTNPANPLSGANMNNRYDDEAYNLTSFLSAGDTAITLNTRNPSGDDNIFFAGFNISGIADDPGQPPVDVSEPGTTVLLLLGLMGLLRARKR